MPGGPNIRTHQNDNQRTKLPLHLCSVLRLQCLFPWTLTIDWQELNGGAGLGGTWYGAIKKIAGVSQV